MSLSSIICTETDVDAIIRHYFNQEMSNKEILQFCTSHHITISLSTLKRKLKSMNLRRRISDVQQRTQRATLVNAVQKATSDSGSVLGTPYCFRISYDLITSL